MFALYVYSSFRRTINRHVLEMKSRISSLTDTGGSIHKTRTVLEFAESNIKRLKSCKKKRILNLQEKICFIIYKLVVLCTEKQTHYFSTIWRVFPPS